MNPQEMFKQADAWAEEKVRGAGDGLDKPSTCEGWTVQQLIEHMHESKKMFADKEQTDEVLGVSAADRLLHGWDVAKSTGQDTAMPTELAANEWNFLDGKLTAENRGTAFKNPLNVADNVPDQDKLLAYSGRHP